MENRQVSIVDFDAGNLLNVARAFEHCGIDVDIADSEQKIQRASRLVLPGVGAFADCINALKQKQLIGAMDQHVKAGKPLLGICVGMQMLFDSSEEFGHTQGLGYIPGTVTPIPPFDMSLLGSETKPTPYKIPHIGWSELNTKAHSAECVLLQDLAPGSAVYFVHSYRVLPTAESDCVASTEYGGHHIVAAVQHGNIIGTQFHPEKSGEMGLQIIRNFIEYH